MYFCASNIWNSKFETCLTSNVFKMSPRNQHHSLTISKTFLLIPDTPPPPTHPWEIFSQQIYTNHSSHVLDFKISGNQRIRGTITPLRRNKSKWIHSYIFCCFSDNLSAPCMPLCRWQYIDAEWPSMCSMGINLLTPCELEEKIITWSRFSDSPGSL